MPVTVVVPSRNEAANIEKCLRSLEPAQRVLVVDSQSTDGTPELAQRLGAEVVTFVYQGGYPKKRQWVLDHGDIKTDWVLLVDADEIVTHELWLEISYRVRYPGRYVAFAAKKEFHFLGKRFRFGGFSFQAVVLFRRGKARFERLLEDDPSGMDVEVHERLVVDGMVGRLLVPLVHDDWKGLDAYVERHLRYAAWEAKVRQRYRQSGQYGLERIKPNVMGNCQEVRRFWKLVAIRLPGEPLWWFVYHYLFRLGILEGKAGLLACLLRAFYILIVHGKLYEWSLGGNVQRDRVGKEELSVAAVEEKIGSR